MTSHLLTSGAGVNAKTGSDVRFNLYIDLDLRGFTRQTSSCRHLTIMHKTASIKSTLTCWFKSQLCYVTELTGPNISNWGTSLKWRKRVVIWIRRMENGETRSTASKCWFIVAFLCITVKSLQRTCLPCKSTEIRVDMSIEAHTATGFGIYPGPRRQQMALLRESGYWIYNQIL
jgi:hypothetical protein